MHVQAAAALQPGRGHTGPKAQQVCAQTQQRDNCLTFVTESQVDSKAFLYFFYTKKCVLDFLFFFMCQN